MKTPKRKKPCGEFSPQHYTWEGPNDDAWRAQRWKRKNRIAQLKRTIARLNAAFTAERKQLNALWLGDQLKRYSPEWDAFILLRGLKTPAEDAPTDAKRLYWLDLRKIGGLLLNAACLAAREAGRAEEKEAYCLAQTAENAKQTTLIFTDAEQLTERKGN